MVRDDGGQAFPIPEDAEHCRVHGMSLRDYFAAHAPDVPDWFHHDTPAPGHPGEPPPAPTWDNDGPPEIVNARWQAFQEVRRAWEKENDAWERRHDAWSVRDRAERLIRWRWAYADAMIAGRNG